MPACLPNLVADVNHLGRSQRLATILVTCIRYLPYEERLQRLAFIPCRGDDFGPTWLPHSRYSRVFWMWILIFFSFLPLDTAQEGTPKRYSKVRATAEGEGWPFWWAMWNTGISPRLPSLRLFLSIFSRKGWRKFGQKSFPILPTDWRLNLPMPNIPFQLSVWSVWCLQARCGFLFTIISQSHNHFYCTGFTDETILTSHGSSGNEANCLSHVKR